MDTVDYWLMGMVGIVGNWIFLTLLFRELRGRHPTAFADLGSPSWTTYWFAVPWGARARVRRRFRNFVFRGQFLELNDRALSVTGWALLASDVLALAGIFGIFVGLYAQSAGR
jgi:hypothetical protein